jgi:hypothetical protein
MRLIGALILTFVWSSAFSSRSARSGSQPLENIIQRHRLARVAPLVLRRSVVIFFLCAPVSGEWLLSHGLVLILVADPVCHVLVALAHDSISTSLSPVVVACNVASLAFLLLKVTFFPIVVILKFGIVRKVLDRQSEGFFSDTQVLGLYTLLCFGQVAIIGGILLEHVQCESRVLTDPYQLQKRLGVHITLSYTYRSSERVKRRWRPA